MQLALLYKYNEHKIYPGFGKLNTDYYPALKIPVDELVTPGAGAVAEFIIKHLYRTRWLMTGRLPVRRGDVLIITDCGKIQHSYIFSDVPGTAIPGVAKLFLKPHNITNNEIRRAYEQRTVLDIPRL